MAINRRLTGGRKLRYHKLFGSLESPPLGWVNEAQGVGFSLADYNREVDAQVKLGKLQSAAHREVARIHGHKAWGHHMGTGFACCTVYLPLSAPQPHPPMSKDPVYRHRDERFIAGWWYDRHAGMGPTSTYGAWVATCVGYISEGPPHRALHNEARYDEEPKYREGDVYYLDPPHCVGINPYRDFKYIGDFARPGNPDLSPSERAADVEAEIIFQFLKLHNLNGAKK